MKDNDIFLFSSFSSHFFRDTLPHIYAFFRHLFLSSCLIYTSLLRSPSSSFVFTIRYSFFPRHYYHFDIDYAEVFFIFRFLYLQLPLSFHYCCRHESIHWRLSRHWNDGFPLIHTITAFAFHAIIYIDRSSHIFRYHTMKRNFHIEMLSRMFNALLFFIRIIMLILRQALLSLCRLHISYDVAS